MAICVEQLSLGFNRELIVDLFAGGGGTSTGLERAAGRSVDIAVNHDPYAVSMHAMNHPGTTHYCESVFKVNPSVVTRNQPVGLLWASPDCTSHSNAKGSAPVKKKLRGLAWVVLKWARRTRPRILMLENVEEFQKWGPLKKDNTPCRAREGREFKKFVNQIERQGYRVEHRVLAAHEYGAPTIRKRLFLIARRDGLPITWPEPTHADPAHPDCLAGKKLPYRNAAECLDFSIPSESIFEREKPLVEKTLRRITAGIQDLIIDSDEPFVIKGENPKLPFFIQRYGERTGQRPRTRSVEKPIGTITPTGNQATLVEVVTRPIADYADHVEQMIANYGTGSNQIGWRAGSTDGASDNARAVSAFLAPYYTSGSGTTGRDVRLPIPTITAKDRFQVVTVDIDRERHVITDICTRMMTARESYRAQGFPEDYVIDRGVNCEIFPGYVQKRLVGNSVCPDIAYALAHANLAHERGEISLAA